MKIGLVMEIISSMWIFQKKKQLMESEEKGMDQLLIPRSREAKVTLDVADTGARPVAPLPLETPVKILGAVTPTQNIWTNALDLGYPVLTIIAFSVWNLVTIF